MRVKPLRVSYAAHSQSSRADLAGVPPTCSIRFEFETPRTTLVSNCRAGSLQARGDWRPNYWLTHMRAPVRFCSSMQTLAAQGITHFVEIGPHPVLLGMGAECIPERRVEWLPSLRRDRPDWSDLFESLQRLYVGGADVDWDGVRSWLFAPPRRIADLSVSAARHWMDAAAQPATPPKTAPALWAHLQSAMDRQAEQGPLDLNVSSYPEKWDCLARLTSAHAIRTLREAGVFAKAGERRTLDQVIETASNRSCVSASCPTVARSPRCGGCAAI